MKTKITLTLDDYEARVFEKAVRIAVRLLDASDATTGDHRRFILRWIIGAVSSAIIRKGEMPKQLAVELRHETQEEMRKRVEKEIPASPDDMRHSIPPPNRWN